MKTTAKSGINLWCARGFIFQANYYIWFMNEVKIFEHKEIRSVYYKNEWYFAVVDVVEVVAESSNPSEYLKKLRRRDPELGKGWGQIVHPLSIETKGGMQRTNCANKEGILRIIQSIPSKNAEPFKRWLAKVGSQAIDEKNNKRIVAFKKLKESQKRLYDNAIERGISPEEFEQILDAGDFSLFGGVDIKAKYGVAKNEKADEHMNTLLLYGKGFATEITNHNTSRDNLKSSEEMSEEHQSNNSLIRQNLLDKNIVPEELPAEKRIEIEKLEGDDTNKLDD